MKPICEGMVGINADEIKTITESATTETATAKAERTNSTNVIFFLFIESIIP